MQEAWQGEDIVLQDIGKSNDLAAARIQAVADNLVVGVVGRGNVVEGSVLFGFFDMQLQQIETVVDGEVVAAVAQVEGIEAGLCLAKSYLHFAGLQYLGGVIRRETERQAAVYDILTQSECQIDDTFFGLLVPQGIVVERACHARHAGIEAGTVLVADYFLEDDGHLLLVDDVARGLHVGFGVSEVDGGVNTLDRVAQHAEHLVLVVQVGNHVRIVNAGKGLVVRVFEQRRRTDGDGRLHHVEEGEEVLDQAVGQLGLEEIAQDGVVVRIRQGYLVEVIGLHELVEHVGTEHDGLGNGYTGVVEFLELGMALYQIVDESQAAALASQRAFTDAGKVGVAVEAVALEDSHHALVLHLAVLDDGFEDDLAVGIHVLQGIPGDGFQEFGDGEHGTRVKPAADVVAADVVEERF